ncbi:MAG: PAS domain S-box protein [Bacteroidales bacterium]|nr:PAS domain S-box protein [Bacteroidales bacterium]
MKSNRPVPSKAQTNLEALQQMKEQLLRSEEHFRMLFDKAPLGYQSLDGDGYFVDVNQAWCETLGYPKEAVIGRWFGDFLVPEYIESFRHCFSQFKQQGTIHSEFEMQHHNGERRYIAFEGRIGFTPDGRIERTHCILQDITELKQVEKREKEHLRQLNSLMSNLPGFVYRCRYDENWTMLYLSEGCLAVTGYHPEDLIGNKVISFNDIIKEDFREYLFKKWEQALSNHTSFLEEYEIITASGETRWVLEHAVEVCDNNNNLQFLEGYIEDITTRKQAESALKESEETIRLLFNSTAEGIYGIDTNGHCIFCNKAALTLLEFANEQEVLGKNIHQLIHHSHKNGKLLPEKKCRRYKAFIDGKGSHCDQEVFWTKKGTSFPVEYWSYPIFRENKIIGSVVTFVDITQKQQLNEALVNSESKYRYLFENNPAPMWIYDEVSLAFLEVNEAAIEHYGYTRDEFLQLTIKDIRPLEDVERLMKDVDDTYKPLNRAGALRHIKKSGEIIYVDIVSHQIDYESKRARLVISTDITERIEMEKALVKAKEKAEESDRLKSAFLANMSHEIRTPMNSILGFSELLKDPQFDDKQKEAFIQIITTNGNSLLNIINDIIDISKIEAGEMTLHKTVVDVEQVMESLENQYSFQEVKPSVNFRWPKPQVTQCVSVLADKERMLQVLNNLISNALKFTDEGYIEVGYQPTDEQVTFYVKDTGIGIDPEYHTLIFKRFRQVEAGTSRVFGGNGLGLAICKHLVGLMGGTLWVDSEKGKGATFYFTLPLT